MLVTLFRVEIGILFFLFTVPIIALMKKFSGFPQGNNIADFLLIAIILGWLLGAGKQGKKIFNNSPINIAVILVVIGAIINLVRGYTFMVLPEEINIVRLMAWKNYMILPLLYFIAINNIETEKLVKWCIVVVSITMIAMDFNFYTTFRLIKAVHYSHSIRISGPFAFLGPNELGVFASMYTFLLFGISYFIEDKKLKYWLLLVCCANFYTILYCYSRAGYMCTLFGFFFLGILKDKRFLLLLAALIIAYKIVLPTSVVERIDNTFLEKGEISERQEETSAFEVGDTVVEVTGRKQLWEKAMYYFEREPLFGIGFDTFRHQEGWITHSLYMKILAEQGLVGAIIFLIFIAIILSQAFKLFKHSETKIGKGVGLGFLLCVLVQLVGSVTGDQSLYYNMMAIYWVFLGIVASLNINRNQGLTKSPEIDKK